MTGTQKAVALHLGVVAALFALQFVLAPYHHTNVARIMVLAVYALGYNILLGYTGLMSLGHAMFFAAGMYGAGLPIYYLDAGAPLGFLLGIVSGLVLSVLFGLLALRTTGVAFLIVSMMIAQALYLASLYFNEITLGDQGFILKVKALAGVGFHEPVLKYNGALALFAAALLACLALRLSPIGRVLVAIRENEERTRLLGYDTHRYRLIAVVVSGLVSGLAGVTYTLLFSYVGSTFASVQHSIDPLLATLLGGAGTTLGPLVGTLLMTYLVDVAKGFTVAYLVVVGVALVVVVLWAPAGVVGGIRARWVRWLP